MIFGKILIKTSKKNVEIEKLQSITSIHENEIDQSLVKCDDNKQHSSRRSCFYVQEVNIKENENQYYVMNTSVKCYSSLNVLLYPNDIDRAHHIGLSYTDNHSGKK